MPLFVTALLWAGSVMAGNSLEAEPTETTPPRNDVEVPRKEEVLSSWALVILTSLLFITLFLSYVFRVRRIWLLHETIVSLCMGVVVGFVIMVSPGSSTIQRLLSFNHKLFFNLLLPPIILHSGYELNMKNFFRNLGSISMFAFVGTFISTLIIGSLTFLFTSVFYRSLKLAFVDCVIFGAILSSTDPVTVIALFEQLNIDKQLYTIIFGESILNDSVAIVLFGTLGRYQGTYMGVLNIFQAILTFTAVFVGSVTIGILVALCCALILKFSNLSAFPSTESSLILLMAYFSYIFSNASEMSGIVSLLFCAITLKHYAYDNMSTKTRQATLMMVRVLGTMSENFIFIYLGVSLFSNTEERFYILLIVFTMFSVLVARYCSIFPLAALLNRLHEKIYPKRVGQLIPENHQKMMWWSGLRGAIAFALSYDVVGPGAGAIRTTTLVICVTSVICLGGTTAIALQELGLVSPDELNHARHAHHPPKRTKNFPDGRDPLQVDSIPVAGASSESSLESSSETNDVIPVISVEEPASPDGIAELESANDENSGTITQTWDNYYSRVMDRWHNTDWNHWWLGFDNRWIRPLFTHTEWKWGEMIHPDTFMQYQRARERSRMYSNKSVVSSAKSVIFDASKEQSATARGTTHSASLYEPAYVEGAAPTPAGSSSSPILFELDTFISANSSGKP